MKGGSWCIWASWTRYLPWRGLQIAHGLYQAQAYLPHAALEKFTEENNQHAHHPYLVLISLGSLPLLSLAAALHGPPESSRQTHFSLYLPRSGSTINSRRPAGGQQLPCKESLWAAASSQSLVFMWTTSRQHKRPTQGFSTGPAASKISLSKPLSLFFRSAIPKLEPGPRGEVVQLLIALWAYRNVIPWTGIRGSHIFSTWRSSGNQKKKVGGLLFYIFLPPTENKEVISRQGKASPASAGNESSFISMLIGGMFLSSGDLGMRLSQLVTLHALFKQERYRFHIWHASLKSNHFKQDSFYLSLKEKKWEKVRDNHHSTPSLLKSESLCPTSKTTHIERAFVRFTLGCCFKKQPLLCLQRTSRPTALWAWHPISESNKTQMLRYNR